MVDLTITASDVAPGSNAVKEAGIAGEVLTAGQAVYKKAADNKFWLADNNATAAEAREPYGVALNGAAANQSLVVQRSGNLNVGATVVTGKSYYLGDTPGGVCPETDLGSGERVNLIGIAISTTTINVDIKKSGVAVP